jgi:integrase
MPGELRNPKRGLKKLPEAERRAEYERRLQAAAVWREAHCWHPNQLRHTAGTAIRKRFGVEAARLILGHSDCDITADVYAERDFAVAARVAKEVG